ncbi:hypothetical protein UFOVP568_15 [uncultured Caudovirales phage]|uniref:Uncharacterized protein n=1 Tax=uncultured Caudovirales phage TaxID=2100421 RepID=A0A6J5MT40_9CAUD|nr:hypothetical protein UFOVP568_15 [uncultured Caudovirales phage]
MGTRVKKGKLKPEVKAQWVEALRSGKYKQGQKFLFDDGTQSYCCLGVNCLIQGQQLVAPYDKFDAPMGLPKLHDAMTWWEVKPLREDVDSPRVKYKGRWKRLTDLNDDVGLTFEQIADLIEAQL